MILPFVDIVSSLFCILTLYPTGNPAPLEKGIWPGPGPGFGPNMKVIPSHPDSPIFSLVWPQSPLLSAAYSHLSPQLWFLCDLSPLR